MLIYILLFSVTGRGVRADVLPSVRSLGVIIYLTVFCPTGRGVRANVLPSR